MAELDNLSKRKRYKEFYMDLAKRTGEMSHAVRLKVGTVVVKDGNIISFGWNGTPEGFDNVCEYENENGELVTKPIVMHSEFNALRKLARSTESAQGADMYTTHSCCLNCSLFIAGSGIKNFFYKEDYRSSEGTDFLKQAGVNVVKI